MSVPPWMIVPPPKRPGYGSGPSPFILDQRPADDGTIAVTWSLPGLRRVTVTVPQSAWLDGQHLAVGVLATRLFDALVPATGDDDIPPPTDDVA